MAVRLLKGCSIQTQTLCDLTIVSAFDRLHHAADYRVNLKQEQSELGVMVSQPQ
jgi:hypothetical protein